MDQWTDADYPEQFDKLPIDRQQKLLDWIFVKLTPIQSFNARHTSYGLKHLVSFEDGADSYFTNGEFKGAMLRSGYKVQNKSELNWVFNIGEKSPIFKMK